MLKKKLSKTQYWLVIILGFGMLFINGYLVYGLFTNEIEIPLNCPIPIKDISWCECKYSSLDNKDFSRELEICYCYPHGVNTSMLKPTYNFTTQKLNISELLNGTK